MMKPQLLTALSTLALIQQAQAFSFGFPSTIKLNPILQKYISESNKETTLKIKLIIESNENKLPIDGLQLQLLNTPPSKPLTMPGANGPNPQISTGVQSLSILQPPGFITLSGHQRVDLQQGCWEMGWRDDHPAGALIVGCHNPEGVQRTAAGPTLPSGRIYMSFPLWSREGLTKCRAHRAEWQEVNQKYLQEKEEALMKYNEETNLLMKALHYRNAFAAVEKLMLSKERMMGPEVPEEEDLVLLEERDGLFLCGKGTVWTKKQGFFGGEHVLLGYATAELVLPSQ